MYTGQVDCYCCLLSNVIIWCVLHKLQEILLPRTDHLYLLCGGASYYTKWLNCGTPVGVVGG